MKSLYNETVDIVCSGNLPNEVPGMILYDILNNEYAMKSQSKTAKFVTKLLSCGNSFPFYESELKKLVEKIRDGLTDKELHELKECLMQHNLD